MIPKLRNWSIGFHPDASLYDAPEVQTFHLYGEVYGYEGKPDGWRIVTSPIVLSDDNGKNGLVKCESRSYQLEGPPSQDYVTWCISKGYEPPTLDRPIRIIPPSTQAYELDSQQGRIWLDGQIVNRN